MRQRPPRDRGRVPVDQDLPCKARSAQHAWKIDAVRGLQAPYEVFVQHIRIVASVAIKRHKIIQPERAISRAACMRSMCVQLTLTEGPANVRADAA